MASQTFSYTGAVQDFVVPNPIVDNRVTIECWGAQGGDGYYDNNTQNTTNSPTSRPGGYGGYAKGDLAVTPGETLKVYVGGTGSDYDLSAATSGGGGWNGGGDARAVNGDRGGGGGGASDVRQGGTALGNRKIVGAGGAGDGAGLTSGTGSNNNIISKNGNHFRGMHGGAATGEEYETGLQQNAHGGTQSAGGAKGDFLDDLSGYTTNGSATATSGSSGQGGHGGARDITRSGRRSWFSAGGAGGGYYGGGGGDIWLVPGLNSGYEDVLGGDSGGGSNYVGGVTSTTSTRGVRTGHGQVTITYTLPPAVPTGVEVVSAIPSAAGEVREPRPTLRADIPAHPDDAGGLTHQLEFQVSRNSGFSDLVGTYTTAMVDATAEDNDQDAAVGVDLDNNTTFWVRARSKDSRGNASAWTAGISFEVIYENSWGGGFI